MSKNTIRLGFIGTGRRGTSLLRDALDTGCNVTVAALCDTVAENLQTASDAVVEKGGKPPARFTDYHALLACKDVDAVVIATSWETHARVACDAMEAGKIVGCEVGGAYSLEECWQLVHTHRRTGTPIMMLENCCWGRDELMVQSMVEAGVFGELVHIQGGYRHDVRSLVVDKSSPDHFRLKHYMARCCDYYPTHDLGPIAQILKLGRGNRMLSVVSVASRAAGLNDYAMRSQGPEHPASRAHFAQGDVVSTLIRCAGGQTIALFLDTTLPRFYSRGLQVQGTRAMYCEDNRSLFIDGEHQAFEVEWKGHWGNIEEYRQQYEHPVWRAFLAEGKEGGHGGMDLLMLRAFFETVQSGAPMPIDVYDMAEWKSISVLTERSILEGGAPQEMPDFRGGSWVMA